MFLLYHWCISARTAAPLKRPRGARADNGGFGMAPEPHGFRDTIEDWPRLTRAQRAALARRLVARSRGGYPVTEQMLELLTLFEGTGKGAATSR